MAAAEGKAGISEVVVQFEDEERAGVMYRLDDKHKEAIRMRQIEKLDQKALPQPDEDRMQLDDTIAEYDRQNGRMWLRMPLFWFPYVVRGSAIRLVSLFVCTLCALLITYREEVETRYITFGLFIDCSLRFFYGPSGSALGALCMYLSHLVYRLRDAIAKEMVNRRPDYEAGPARQFSALWGAILSGVATILMFWTMDAANDAGLIAACVVLGVLMLSSFLDAVVNLCLFRLLFDVTFAKIPAISQTLRKIGTIMDEVCRNDVETELSLAVWTGPYVQKEAAAHLHVELDFENHISLYAEQVSEGPNSDYPVPLKYKHTTEELKRETYHFVRYAKPSFFGVPMALAGLGCAWRYCESLLVAPYWPAQICGYISAVLFVFHGICYLLKSIIFPRKVYKDWLHTHSRNYFLAFTTTIVLYSFLVQDHIFAKALWWIGALTQITVSTVVVAMWVKYPSGLDYVDGSWLLVPLGNLVSAWLAPNINSDLSEPGWLWFSFGFLMWISLLPLVFYRVFFGGAFEEKSRSGLFSLVALPAMTCLAYLAINPKSMITIMLTRDPITNLASTSQVMGWDAFSRFNLYSSITMFFVMAWLVPLTYLGRRSHSLEDWGFSFPLSCLAMVCIKYYDWIGNDLTLYMAEVSLAGATIVTATLLFHTVRLILMGREIYTPEEQVSPLSFLKMAHHAFRRALHHIDVEVGNLRAYVTQIKETQDYDQQVKNIRFLHKHAASLVSLLDMVQAVHVHHSEHEDLFVFPLYRQWFTAHVEKQHPLDEHFKHSVAWSQLCDNVRGWLERLPGDRSLMKIGPVREELSAIREETRAFEAILLDDLCKAVKAQNDALRSHLLEEEKDLDPIGAKYVPFAEQKAVLRKIFEHTPADQWRVVMPWLINNQYMHSRRITILKCLRWAVPEKMQLIGMWIWDNVDDLTWNRLIVDIPEIIPRRVDGHIPYFA